MNYTAPLTDMRFLLEQVTGLDTISQLPGCEDATADTVADEAASLSYDGLDTEFTSRNLREVAAMDAARAVAAYREFVDGQWTVVLVGDAQAFLADVQALGRGEVTVVPN